MHLEPGIGGNNGGGRRKVVCEVKGDGGHGGNVANKGDCRVGQGSDDVVWVSWVLGRVQRKIPVFS